MFFKCLSGLHRLQALHNHHVNDSERVCPRRWCTQGSHLQSCPRGWHRTPCPHCPLYWGASQSVSGTSQTQLVSATPYLCTPLTRMWVWEGQRERENREHEQRCHVIIMTFLQLWILTKYYGCEQVRFQIIHRHGCIPDTLVSRWLCEVVMVQVLNQQLSYIRNTKPSLEFR